MVSLMELIVVAKYTIANPGRRARNVAPKPRSNPGYENAGMPIQGASTTFTKSYRPQDTAMTKPVAIAATGAHCCHLAEENNRISMRMARGTPASTGTAAKCAPSGTPDSRSRTVVIAEKDRSTRTVPATTGVIMRRSKERREINRNCIRGEATIGLDSKAGPPAASAEALMTMN